MITHIDMGVEQILATLNELGLEENTIVIFTSDNGPTYNRLGGSDSEFFKSAGEFRGFKGSVYEGGIRVPLVIRWPGKIEAGTISGHISAFQDILPTLAEIAGAKTIIPQNIDGISFTPTIQKQGIQNNHENLYMEFPGYGGQQMVRMGKWKGVRKEMSKGNMHIELYNLEEDISEQNDISLKNPDIVEKIREIMKIEHVPSDIFPFEQIDTIK